MTRRSPVPRSIALALLLARVVAFTVAPFLERGTAQQTDVAAIDGTGQHNAPSAPAHDPANCPACVLLQGYVAPPVLGLLLAHGATAHAVAGAARPLAAWDRILGFDSRAPPTSSV